MSNFIFLISDISSNMILSWWDWPSTDFPFSSVQSEQHLVVINGTGSDGADGKCSHNVGKRAQEVNCF